LLFSNCPGDSQVASLVTEVLGMLDAEGDAADIQSSGAGTSLKKEWIFHC
jgi:hypothetical protein